MNYLQKNDAGFTLIEMIIVVAILGILAGLAYPYYTNYTQGAKVTGAATVIAGWQTAIEQCILDKGELAGCDGGTHSIPADVSPGSDTNFIESLTVKDGKIDAVTTGQASDGSKMTLIYTPTINKGYVDWALTGTGCESIKCTFK